MARKKATHEKSMSSSSAEAQRPRADRHKPRRSVTLPPSLHEMLAQLADENQRPLLWELRIAVTDHLRRHGKLPPS